MGFSRRRWLACLILALGVQGGVIAAGTERRDKPVPGPLSLELAMRPHQEAIAFEDREFVLTFRNTSDTVITIDRQLLSECDMGHLTDARGRRVVLHNPSPPGEMTSEDIISIPPGGSYVRERELSTMTPVDLKFPPYTLSFCYSNKGVAYTQKLSVDTFSVCSNPLRIPR
jgi:hypothetical protein